MLVRPAARMLFSVAFLLVLFVSPVLADQSYTFHYRQPQVGDHADQSIDSTLQLKVGIQQSGQTISSSDSTVQQVQQRGVTVLKRDTKRVLVARVAYQKSWQITREGDGQPTKRQHPVVGKTYLVSRPDKKLVVTYEDGSIPPPEEIAIVQPSMESLGQPNPIAKFFDGRTMTVGETVQIPIELASELLGFRDNVGEVTRFQMTLTEVKTVDGSGQAILKTKIDAGELSKDPMTMRVTGRLVMEIDTCRLLGADFIGPVEIREQKGPVGAQFTIAGQGNLRVSIHSKRSVKR